MPKFKIVDEGSGFYTVKNVPIFEVHTDRGFLCDANWMNSAIQQHATYKAGGFRPTIIIGHGKKDGIEKEAVGFLDGLVLKGKRLYADLVHIPKEIKEKIVRNAFPNRSVEVLPKSKRILGLAFLGGTTPHFALPQMVYESDEKSKWYRSPTMLDEQTKNEIFELVGSAVAESIPELLTRYFSDNGEGEEAPLLFTDEDGTEYAIPTALLKGLKVAGRGAAKGAGAVERGVTKVGAATGRGVASAGRGAAMHPRVPFGAAKGVTKAGRAMLRHPLATGTGVISAGAVGGARAAGFTGERRRKGYAIDEDSGEIFCDGEPVGVAIDYATLAEAGYDVPQAVKHPEDLPAVEESKPALKIKAGDVGEGSRNEPTLETEPGAAGGSFVDPLNRKTSDQFTMDELAAENYDLHQRLGRVETANALITEGRKAEAYTRWLSEQKAAGAPVGDIEQTVAFLMTCTEDGVKEFKALMETQPRVALGKIETTKTFDLKMVDDIKADYEANKDTYKSMGVSEKDLQYTKYISTNMEQPVQG